MKKYNVTCELEFEYLASDTEHAIDMLTNRIHNLLVMGELLENIGTVNVKEIDKISK